MKTQEPSSKCARMDSGSSGGTGGSMESGCWCSARRAYAWHRCGGGLQGAAAGLAVVVAGGGARRAATRAAVARWQAGFPGQLWRHDGLTGAERERDGRCTGGHFSHWRGHSAACGSSRLLLRLAGLKLSHQAIQLGACTHRLQLLRRQSASRMRSARRGNSHLCARLGTAKAHCALSGRGRLLPGQGRSCSFSRPPVWRAWGWAGLG